jgi:hypothetical protein
MSTLTAPIRWAGQAVRGVLEAGLALPRATKHVISRSAFRRRPPWLDEGGTGVREPRRPGPNPPVGAMALNEPHGPNAAERGSARRDARGGEPR